MDGYQPQQQYYNPYLQQIPQPMPPQQMPWAQQRLAQLEQNYMQRNPQQYQGYQNNGQQAVQNTITAIPVTGLDEAKAYPITFDDKIYLFIDRSTNKIYAKQWDKNTGGALFNTYMPEINNQITSTENNIENAQNTDIQAIQDTQSIPVWKDDINRLENEIKRLEGIIYDATSNDADVTKKSANKSTNATVTSKSKSDGDTGKHGTK